ncbi:MAG TPA: aldehyde dehydrogenase family protein, partial [Methanomassiliicoccales archaeon]|nr:aldehyde dehydrogenase family protein [Methanomassiliicoccales archaeon]
MEAIPCTHLNGSVIRIFDPATLRAVGEVKIDDPGAVDHKVALSRKAQSLWASMPMNERVAVLVKAQNVVCGRMEEIAKTVHSETGKPRLEAIANDVMAGLGVGDFALEEIRDIFKPRKMDLGRMDLPMRLLGRRSYTQARPVGVIGI